jgi:hypothetical protein
MIKEFKLDEIRPQSFVEADKLEMSLDIKNKIIILKITNGYSMDIYGDTALIEDIEITISSWDNIYVKSFNSALEHFENVSTIHDALLLNVCQFIYKSATLELQGYMRDDPEWSEWLITNPVIKIIAKYSE